MGDIAAPKMYSGEQEGAFTPGKMIGPEIAQKGAENCAMRWASNRRGMTNGKTSKGDKMVKWEAGNASPGA